MSEKIDRAEIFPTPTCSNDGCLSIWAKICPHCSLAFCGVCVSNHKDWRSRQPCTAQDRAVREALYLTDLTETKDPVEDAQPCPPQP